MTPVRRWCIVAVGLALVIGTPLTLRAVPAHDEDVSAEALLSRVAASEGHAYSGYVESLGTLELPVADRFTDVADEIDPRLAEVRYPVIADSLHELGNSFGVLNDEGAPHRATFIIDPDGVLVHTSVSAHDVGRNVDDPTRWVLTTRWEGPGAYRRALSAYDVKVEAWPVLGRAVDEPSAYETLEPGERANDARPRVTD